MQILLLLTLFATAWGQTETSVGCAACAGLSGKKRWTCEANACPGTQELAVAKYSAEFCARVKTYCDTKSDPLACYDSSGCGTDGTGCKDREARNVWNRLKASPNCKDPGLQGWKCRERTVDTCIHGQGGQYGIELYCCASCKEQLSTCNFGAESEVGSAKQACIISCTRDGVPEDSCKTFCRAAETDVGSRGGECKKAELDNGCKTVMKPFLSTQVPTCQCPETAVGSCFSRCKRDGGSQDHCTWYCGYNSEKAVGGWHTDKYCTRHSDCTEHSQGSCDNRSSRCHYGSWAGGAEKAVGGWHTDKYCTRHSDCTEHSQGSCDNRSSRCHYGSWAGGAEKAVGGWHTALTMAETTTTQTPLAVTIFAAIGLAVSAYGAFKHYTKP